MIIAISFLPLSVVGFLLWFRIFSNNVLLFKRVALAFSFIILNVTVLLWLGFDSTIVGFQNFTQLAIGSELLAYYSIGIDGLSLFFIVLTALLITICILCSWINITYRVMEFIIILFSIEFVLFNVFLVLDIFLFYIFFEVVLLPMVLLVGIWGSWTWKIHATYQFFLYTLIGSLFMLLAIILIYMENGSTNIVYLLNSNVHFYREKLIWLGFFIAFAVKIPMMPCHIWLPEAHVEAPTAGSVILAGILLKMGGYGLLWFSLPLMPDATVYFTPLVYTVSIVSILYSTAATIRQIDLKKIIAYSSIGHMNFVVLGIIGNTQQSISGSILLMLGHGLISSALFLAISVIYDRYHTWIIEYYGGLVYGMPIFAVLFLFFILSNISFPGTANFIGELLVIIGIYEKNVLVVFVSALSIILSAIYNIWLYNKIFFGSLWLINLDNKVYFSTIHGFKDVNKWEFLILIILCYCTFALGMFPNILGENFISLVSSDE